MGRTKALKKTGQQKEPANDLLNAIVDGIKEKKGHSIVVMNLRTAGSAIADYFVVCHGDSKTQVEAIARSVEEVAHKNTGEYPSFREGYANAEWILLDYINIVVHIFEKGQRDFYGIERFWADAETQSID